MAFKIPESPNIVGGAQYLRQPQNLQGTTVVPDMKLDTRPFEEMASAVGYAVADYADRKNATFMAAAHEQFETMMNNEWRRVQDKYKGASAMDLYTNHMKPYAKKLLENMTGEPKDDGMLRIANGELKNQFSNWVYERMPSYNAQCATYEAREMENYNKQVTDSRLKQIAQNIMNAETDDQIYQAQQDMMTLGQLNLRGAPKEYIAQWAAANIDADVKTMLVGRAQKDPNGVSNLLDSKIISESLTSASRAEVQKAVEDNFGTIASNALADDLYNNTSNNQVYLSRDTLERIYRTNDDSVLARKRSTLAGKAKELRDARLKNDSDYNAQVIQTLSEEFSNAVTDDDKARVITNAMSFDPRLGRNWQESFEKEQADAYIMERKRTLESIINTADEDEDVSEYQTELDDIDVEVRRIGEDRIASMKTYTKLLNQLNNGTWSGTYNDEYGTLSVDLKQDLASAVKAKGYMQTMREQMPWAVKQIQSAALPQKKYYAGAENQITNEFMRLATQYKAENGTYPTEIRGGEDLVRTAVSNVIDRQNAPIRGALSENVIDMLDKVGVDYEINPSAARKLLKKVGELPQEDILFTSMPGDEKDLQTKPKALTIKEERDFAGKQVDALLKNYGALDRRTIEEYRDNFIDWIIMSPNGIAQIDAFLKGFIKQ